jgi:hypothetical protein
MAPVCLVSEADSACPIPGFGKKRAAAFAATCGGLAAGKYGQAKAAVLCRRAAVLLICRVWAGNVYRG